MLDYEKKIKREREKLLRLFFFLNLDFTNPFNDNEILKIFERIFNNNGAYQLERLKIQTNFKGTFEGIVNYVCVLDEADFKKLFKYYEPKINKKNE